MRKAPIDLGGGFFRIDVATVDGWAVDVVLRSDGTILIDVEGDNGEDARVALPGPVAAALGLALVDCSSRAPADCPQRLVPLSLMPSHGSSNREE